jgi:ABC-type transport system involved in cytochrome c biogenesis ATPase subunit
MDNVRSSKALRPITGGTLDPADVIGRDPLVEHALERLRAGQNLIVTDPRRMGKTSFLARLVLLARPQSHAIKIDFEGVTSAQEFLLQLCTGLLGFAETGHRVKKALTGVFESLEMQAGPLRIATGMKDRSATELLERVIASVDDHLRDDNKLLIWPSMRFHRPS